LGTLVLRAECQSAQMSEIKNVSLGICGRVQQVEELGFKGLTLSVVLALQFFVTVTTTLLSSHLGVKAHFHLYLMCRDK